jgi:hypothetical protein
VLSQLQIGSITFDGDRIAIDYVDPDNDLRNEGLVMQTHQLTVLRSPAYADEIDALQEAALALLHDALDDYRDTEAVRPKPEEDLTDDDD